MDSVLKWGLILGGGYLVLDYLGINPLAALTGGSTTTPVSTTTPQSTVDSVTSQNTLNMVQQAMQKAGLDPNGYYTTDVLNYYYKMVRNIDAPAPEVLFPNADRNKSYSVSEWWSALSGQGFSGLGIIAHRVNPYANPKGTPFGSNIRSNGSERFNIQMG